jgi:hypothetical protein
MGFRRARLKAKAELRVLAQSLDNELAVLQDDIAGIELEFRQRQALQEAIIERLSMTPDVLLH